MTRMPITMYKYASGLLQKSFHFVKPGIKPYEIARHSIFPNIGKRAELILITKYHIVLSPGEKWRIDIDQINAFAGKSAHHMKIVAPEQAIMFQMGVAKSKTFHHLKRKHYLRKQFLKT